MEPIHRQIVLIAFALLVSACTPATQPSGSPTPSATDSIAGTYSCAPEGVDTTPDVVEVRADGTFTVTHPDAGVTESPGTWSVEGDRGAFNPGTPEEDPFTIEGDRLVFGPDEPVRFVCTPAD